MQEQRNAFLGPIWLFVDFLMSNSDTAWNVFPSCYCAIWVNIHQHFCKIKKTPQAASGSTWRVKAVIIEATSPPLAVSNAAWPAFFSGWQFERTGKTFNFKAALFLLLFPLLLFPIIPRSKVLDLGYDEEDGYARFSHWWGALNMHSVSQLEKGCNFPRRPHHDPNW